MTKQLKWRLGKLPTPDEVLKLVNDKLITKDEAREILFNEEEVTERTKDSLEEEIKFLRETIDKLSKDRSRVVEIIRESYPIYIKQPWIQPYYQWTVSSGTDTMKLCSASATNLNNAIQCSSNYTDSGLNTIQTF